MTWGVGYPPSIRSPSVDLTSSEPCFNSVTSLTVSNVEGTLVYSLLSQNPNGNFYNAGYRIKCNETVLRSNGYSSYTLNVSVSDDVTTLYDTFTVTIFGLPTCSQGSFGLNCSSPCRCLLGANCNHIYGLCPNDQCAPGWITSNCSIACGQGMFGLNCSSTCHCDTCNHVNGSCAMSSQCHDGYRMDNGFCKPCESGSYGQNCSMDCH
ncbi:hypothetical protein DPMN_166442 [Dreissena polymorpha]|uniref:Uncharacterized protein n=1 Tax=Dreissena polymorpha TaxID=45954 RepID=A0A9D4F1H7_DREPO|nr:hypothetical protein DPMN_166442 [Dreissena polymorpha]